jgi:hypothetical protein
MEANFTADEKALLALTFDPQPVNPRITLLGTDLSGQARITQEFIIENLKHCRHRNSEENTFVMSRRNSLSWPDIFRASYK